jgi:UDP-N-acetylglucosamine 2-epimerase (non-hydrolysing)
MQHNQDLCSLTARILEGLRPVLLAERPDLVMTQGDTVSALAASLASFFERIPVAHVEAGLRTYDMHSPFPEEAIRQIISRLTSLHFAPTSANVQTLLGEGFPSRSIFLTGNPVVDSVLWTRDQVRNSRVDLLSAVVGHNSLRSINRAAHILLVTGHRRENFGAGLREICAAVAELAFSRPEIAVVFSVHPNPHVRGHVHSALETVPNVYLTPPLEYPVFIHLMDRSSLILSDSGGVQEEAAALGKQVLVTRTATERNEAVECGVVRIVGANCRNIVSHANEILDAAESGLRSAPLTNPFGDGHTAEKIVAILRQQDVFDRRSAISLQSLAAALGNAVGTPQPEPSSPYSLLFPTR